MTRLRSMAPLLVAAALASIAVYTAQGAGCDDPGRYERAGDGWELVGGCVAPGDIVVPADTPQAPAATDPLTPAKG